MVAVNLPTVAYWQYACCDAVATYTVAGFHWPSSKQRPTNCNENGASELPYTCGQWSNRFFPHVLHTCTVCFFATNISLSKWAEEQCSQAICATVQPCYRASTTVSTHYFNINWREVCLKYFIQIAAFLLDTYNYLCCGLWDRVVATMFSGPCLYTIVMGNSFICSSQWALRPQRYGYINICYHDLWSVYIVIGTPSI